MTEEKILCFFHPENKAMAVCIKCGRSVCSECRNISPTGTAFCPECYIEDFPEIVNRQLKQLEEPQKKEVIPWESTDESIGYLNRFYLSLKEILLHNFRFFSQMPTNGGFFRPLLYALLCNLIGLVFIGVWVYIFFRSSQPVSQFMEIYTAAKVHWAAYLFITVVNSLFNLFIYAAILHGILLILKLFYPFYPNSFEATFRIIAYSTSAMVLGVIPVIGILLVFAVALIFQINGVRHIHGLSPLTAFSVVLFSLAPLLFLSLASMGLY